MSQQPESTENRPIGAIAKDEVDAKVRRARLMWRAKRGLLENDIMITRFFAKYEHLTEEEVYGFDLLMDLPDDELMALIFARKELADVDPSEHMMDAADMQLANHVLQMLRSV